jgi:hypothetical protein
MTDHTHGNSVAAWVAVSVIIVGFLIGAVAVIAAEPPVFLLGVAVVALGLAAGKLLSMAGFGSMPSYTVQEPVPTNLEGPDMSGPRPSA